MNHLQYLPMTAVVQDPCPQRWCSWFPACKICGHLEMKIPLCCHRCIGRVSSLALLHPLCVFAVHKCNVPKLHGSTNHHCGNRSPYKYPSGYQFYHALWGFDKNGNWWQKCSPSDIHWIPIILYSIHKFLNNVKSKDSQRVTMCPGWLTTK